MHGVFSPEHLEHVVVLLPLEPVQVVQVDVVQMHEHPSSDEPATLAVT